MRYKCSICGAVHNDWPALTFDSPSNYNELTQEEKNDLASLNSDFCVISYPDQTDRFIRVVMFQKVIDHPEPLHYGVWASLSEASFSDYEANFEDNAHLATYFGYLCNNIPGYNGTLSIRSNVQQIKGNTRPELIPHADQMEHSFVRDYYIGISIQEAEKRIHRSIDTREMGA
ncbi:MAG: DUF2199 domain-containing protein [Saprospiraceae bacterium]|uniref:DUF2199 domain-containing protein n=1 Tax=Candidatus Opimibacter skivensis TaxID=2982028 RepID=A0A9D7SZP8_9BACT|nr:DUF2199 domain-containing protein [Candidatus Opimibacter skivensis]